MLKQHLSFPFSQAQLKFLTLDSSVPLPEWCRGHGVEVCYGQYIAFSLCCSFLLTFCPCSSVGSLSWAAVLQGKKMCSGSSRKYPSGPVWALPRVVGNICSSAVEYHLLLWPWCSFCCFSLSSPYYAPQPVQCFSPSLKCFQRHPPPPPQRCHK